ncbi:ankyrin repeat domain-containing protein [Polynucleobacter sp. AP-Kolm-20A-A1]|uniref:ankyrin repeat domain-containing protein n=1 Tax=Polynucleobacter sp. AP-Kolm-20A-A1 TaxID=2081041 RepID=UPI001BFD3B8D|nr:ankyrin repeat domain-containing protein [Polynucleobacter sp. AP-Kolm-20A-A1]QWE21527.1 ankyrin repeat domain-containing protein [Polynucleobacter sp. AP-Kolm-20A-A1]
MRILFKLTASFLILLTLFISPSFGQTEDQISAFTKAAKFDDASEVKSLLKNGVSPNTTDPKGNPMLILAIKDKSNAVIELLLADKRTDVDLSNKYGETPLMIASINGDLPLVKTFVLQKKAMVDHVGWTPLHYACTNGHIEIAQFLIANGATVDSRSLNGTTPLMMAVQSGNEQLVKLLLDKGADIQIRNNLGLTAIDIADIYEKPWIGDGLRARWLKLYKQPYVSNMKAAPTKP